ncbi:MAG: hypothetical protein ABIA74_03295 [bacterium]
MEKKTFKFKNLFFLIPISFLVFLFLSFYINHSFSTSILATFITWSFYILCVPAYHGKFILGIPYKMITGKKLLYPERILWPAALIFNLYVIHSFKSAYHTTIITHLFYQILSNPWPHWITIIISSLGTFYRSFLGCEKFYKNKYVNYFLRTLLVILGILTLLYLSYNELIILFNVMA